MSQRELAKRLRVSNASVCRWLNKERNIKLEDAIKVCNLLNLDKEELLGRFFSHPPCHYIYPG